MHGIESVRPVREMLSHQLRVLAEEKERIALAQDGIGSKNTSDFIERYMAMLQEWIGEHEGEFEGEQEPSPPFVVIGADIQLLHLGTMKTSWVRLVFPGEENPDRGRFSYLSETGRQLLMRLERQYFRISLYGKNEAVVIGGIQFPDSDDP
ncbi:GreA/GreB family elongation factor [Paenibacillus ginsengihumi]|uniref:GreA/GreB family elongation factor n=1 Tax=Paenibacillus ginsengihumi TaxID=431596 RepID=UPI00037DA4AC|nr:GreA/GreB family elongation factor [Paenibacillus ginsengihumi]